MHSPRDDSSVYWLQGILNKRVDKYDVAKKSKWRQNRFRVSSINVVNQWGDEKSRPETLTVNLTRDTAWALGMFELPTIIEDELAFRPETGNVKYDKKNKNIMLLRIFTYEMVLRCPQNQSQLEFQILKTVKPTVLTIEMH